jgi:DNA-binding NarL/FixJ family response regulator
MDKGLANPCKRQVLIVDDHPIVRRGLAMLLSAEPDLAVCGEAADVTEAMAEIERLRPDVAIVDLSLRDSNGLDLIKDIRGRWPALPVIVYSLHDERLYAERVLRAGARGYIAKGDPPGNVVDGIRRTLSGGVYVSDHIAGLVIGRLVEGHGYESGGGMDRLTNRELQVFECVGKGYRTRDIAQQLRLSVKTVDAHRENIKRKLKLSGAAELHQQAIQWVQSRPTGG